MNNLNHQKATLKDLSAIIELMIQTSDFLIIEQVLKGADETTLIIFDVDDVLLHYATDEVLNNKQLMLEKISYNRSKEDIDLLYSVIFLERKTKPVDERLISLIKYLQNNRITVLGLTNCFTEKFGKITSLKNWRINELKRFGYNLNKSWSKFDEISFHTLITQDIGKFPVFKEGVVFTYNLPKGIVLKEFLDSLSLTFKKIIFIDDVIENLQSVQRFSEEASIDCIAIHYTAAQENISGSFNQLRAEFQVNTLVKKHRWLSDQQADAQISFLISTQKLGF